MTKRELTTLLVACLLSWIGVSYFQARAWDIFAGDLLTTYQVRAKE